jgi:hypothetical protein
VKVLSQVRFNGANSSDPDGRIVDWKWEFGDGATGSGAQAVHAFGDTGTFIVNLSVTDDLGAKNNRSQAVTVVLRKFDVSWNVLPRSLPQMSEYAQENTSANKTVAVSYSNITRMEFRLTWTDDIRHWLLRTYNDDFALRVTDPDNNTQYLRDMNGNISLNFSLTDPPGPATLQARTPEEAMAQVGAKYATGFGRGDWTVQIILGESGGAQDITNPDLDLGNNWKLDVRCLVYELVITEE